MTATVAFKEDVLAGVAGCSRRSALNFLSNYHKAGDGEGADTAASVSTKMFFDTRTLAASANESLDLAGGLTDASGATLTFTEIHAIYVRAADANVNSVQVGGGSNPFIGPFADATDRISVGPGDVALLTSTAGWAVTAATADILRLGNSSSGSAVTYDIVVIGE